MWKELKQIFCKHWWYSVDEYQGKSVRLACLICKKEIKVKRTDHDDLPKGY